MTLATPTDERRGPFRLAHLPRFVTDLFGYGMVSAVALGVDYGLLLALVAGGLHYLAASTVSFLAGMGVAYALSARLVFHDRRSTSQRAEATGFFAVGIAGLILTQLLLFVFVTEFGLGVALAKIPTTCIVFVFNFLCRRSLVFAGGGKPGIVSGRAG